jgi:hypothetical protein
MALDEQVFQVIDLQGNIETPMDSGGHLEITKSVATNQGVVGSIPASRTSKDEGQQVNAC